ncbi:hypothetical protein ACTFIR_009617 [Dictyostelium discoideum]
MKQIISPLLLIVLSLISFSNAYQKLYVNFIPFESVQCSGNPSGIGYGGLVNTCFTFDNSRNWLFNYLEQENSISFTQYYNKGGVTELCEIKSMKTRTALIGECVSGKDLVFNSFYQSVNYDSSSSSSSSSSTSTPEIYYLIQITKDQPFIAPSSTVVSHNYGDCTDGDSDIIYYETFSNQTQVFIPIFGTVSEFYCLDNTPMAMTCDNNGSNCTNPQDQTMNCEAVSPFFNTTASDMSSGDTLYTFNNYCSY